MSVQSVVFATRNAHKVRELAEILAGTGITVLPLSPDAPEVDETEDTFRGNAALKALSAWRHTGLPALADDSGICVQALDGRPGVHSARYSGDGATAESNNAALVRALAGVADRRAWYACVLALVCPSEWIAGRGAPPVGVAVVAEWPGLPAGQRLVFAEGRVDGEFIDQPHGHGGFGYDPHFWLASFGRTMAALSADEKHAISHRGVAMRRLAAYLA